MTKFDNWFNTFLTMSKKELQDVLPVYDYIVCRGGCSTEDVDKLLACLKAIATK